MKILAPSIVTTILPIVASLCTSAVAAPLAPDFTGAIVPDFRGWESTAYAGWNDWSLVDAGGLFALPDDPASNAAFARVTVAPNGTALTSGGAGVICTDGFPLPNLLYSGSGGLPIREVVVQLKGVGNIQPTLYLEYFGDVPFNPDSDILTPVEVTQLGPGETSYRFLTSAFGLGLGAFGNFYGFTVVMDASGSTTPGCIDAVQLDVRHALADETNIACPIGVPNSLGVYAGVDAGGSGIASNNLLKLTASGIPQASFGFFITSQTPSTIPCSTNCSATQGNLCLAGSIARLLRAGSGGDDFSFSRPLDLTAIPLATPTAVVAGSTWYFQAWYRDANPQVTSNFTQAVSVLFR